MARTDCGIGHSDRMWLFNPCLAAGWLSRRISDEKARAWRRVNRQKKLVNHAIQRGTEVAAAVFLRDTSGASSFDDIADWLHGMLTILSRDP